MELRDCILGERFQFPPKVEMDEAGAKILSELAVISYDPINKMVDEMILKEIIQVAKDRGITDLTILNRRFIVDALLEKRDRMNGKVDATPVVHGQWLSCFEDWRMQIEGDKCSVCGFEHYGTPSSEFKFCPNCGAKMDGGTTL